MAEGWGGAGDGTGAPDVRASGEAGEPPVGAPPCADASESPAGARTSGAAPVGAAPAGAAPTTGATSGATPVDLALVELPPVASAPGPPPAWLVERQPALDVLRGWAILGLLPANLPTFALPTDVVHDTWTAAPGPGEAVAHAAWLLLIDRKCISVFALLFGVGLALQLERARARGVGLDHAARRLAALGALGLAHALLLWHGDILLPYALLGGATLLLAQLPGRWPLALAAGALAASTLWALLLACLVALFPAGALPPPESSPLAALLADPGSDAAREVAALAGADPGARFEARLALWGQMWFGLVFLFAGQLLGLMLLGAAWVRAGALDPARRAWLGRVVLVGLAVGLPLELAHTAALVRGGHGHAARLALEAVHHAGSLGLALAAAAWVLGRSPAALGRAPLGWGAAVGRVALTAYLAQTALGVAVFYGPPLGLAQMARWTRAEVWALALAAGAVQLALCALWARTGRQGPCEALIAALAGRGGLPAPAPPTPSSSAPT